jgi:gluconolactonase
MDALCDGFTLIEGPLWMPDRGLLFADVLAGGVYCLTASGAVETVFEHRRGIGGMSLHVDGGLVVSGRNLSYKPFAAAGATLTLIEQDEDRRVGFNDITTDAAGRVYAGSLGSSPVFEDGREPRSGDLYLVDLDGSARIVGHDIQLTNGLGFAPDGRTLYHSDTTRGGVFCYDVAEDGELGAKRPFVEVAGADGLVVAEDGSVWVALAVAGGVQVYSPDGTARQFIDIPKPMCTSLCFGGADLKDLYIVCGSRGTGNDNAGAVYKVRTEVAGVPVAPARVALDPGSG